MYTCMPTTVRERTPAVALSGDWEFRTDPADAGVNAAWYDPDAAWDDARTVSVPHSWQEHEDLRGYTGTAWYRRSVSLDEVDPSERALLAFGAVDYEATVWVNGERIGDHEGGYLPFALDATDALTAGENTLVLRVRDPEDLSEIPHGKQGAPWYTRVSGPWQRVDLLTVPEAYVEDVAVTPDLSADAATVAVRVAGPATGAEAEVAIERDGEQVAATTVPVEDRTASATLDVPDAEYWTPDSPTLYDVTVTLETGDARDTYEDYFGMRSVDYADGRVLLNGEPFEVRGALDQAFYPDTYYRPADLSTFEREIRAAQELGFNLLRKHIKPAHPAFVELADRIGILVWEEPANPKRYTDRSKSLLREQLRGMIERDFNSPSVVAWSIYNEEWGIGSHEDEESLWTDAEKQDYLESLYEETLALDPTRLVCDNSGWAHVATDLNDYHEYFVAPDRVDAWRDRLDEIAANPAGNYGDARTDPDEAPLLVSEFGTWGLADVPALRDHYGGDPHWFTHDFLEGMKRPGDVSGKFEASRASDVFDSLSTLADAWQRREFESLETVVADMRTHEGVAGYVVTELSDIEWEFNGILDYLRREKAAADVFARVNAPVMLHLEPSTPAVWAGDPLAADLVVTNGTTEPVELDVTLSAGDAEAVESVAVDPNDSVRVEGAVTVDAPAAETVEPLAVEASAPSLAHAATRSVVVVPDALPEATPTVSADSAALAGALDARGYETVDDHAGADVSLVSDADAVDGTALVVPDADGHLADGDRFSYAELPERESWNLCASFLYQDLFEGVDPVPGWAFADLYPYAYVENVGPDDEVGVGYLEGWLENEGAAVLTRGDVGVCTLRVTDAYGEHPVATRLVERLLADLA